MDGIIYQRGNSWEDLPRKIKDYINDNASDENPIPFTAESIEKISNELGCRHGK